MRKPTANPVYSTSKLVLRRIHAKDIPWTMGCLPNEIGYNASCGEYVHNVTLGGDYYLGVFEVTQYQWYLLCGNRPATYKNELHWERRPVESVSYRQVRDYIFNRTDDYLPPIALPERTSEIIVQRDRASEGRRPHERRT